MPKFNEKNQNINAANITAGFIDPARLPLASESLAGAVKVGEGLEIDENGFLNATASGGSDPLTQEGSVSVTTVTGDNGSILATIGTNKPPSIYSLGSSTTPAIARNATATIGTRVYFVGGANFTTGITSASAMNAYWETSNNSWGVTTASTIKRAGLAAVAYGGKIYKFGGRNDSGTDLDSSEEVNPGVAVTAKQSMSVARWLMGAALVSDKAYVIGGQNAGNAALATNEMYDITNDTWTTKASMSTARRDVAVAAVGNFIYVMGGSTSGGAVSDLVEKYDTVNDTWSTVASMPRALRGCAVVVKGTNIHIFGGEAAGTTQVTSCHYMYDTVENTWTAKAGCGKPRFQFAGGCIGDKIYLYGGMVVTRNGNLTHNSNISLFMEVYDTLTNVWNMPTHVPYFASSGDGGNAVAIVGSRLFFFAAAAGTGAGNEGKVFELDLVNNHWICGVATIPHDSEGFAAVALNDKIYLLGGHQGTFNGSGTTYRADNYEFDPATYTFTQKQSMATSRSAFAAYAYNGKIYALLGRNVGGYVASVEEYDPTGNTWTAKTSCPVGIYQFGHATLNNIVYVFGGWASDVGRTAICRSYNMATNTWGTITSYPLGARYGISAVAYEGTIYTFGGSDGTGAPSMNAQVYSYSTSGNNYTAKSSMPSGRTDCSAWVYGGLLNVTVGYFGNGDGMSFVMTYLASAIPITVNTHGLAARTTAATLTNSTINYTGVIVPVKSGDQITLSSNANTWAGISGTDQIIIS